MLVVSKSLIGSFHKRIVNLSILRIIYFLKKACNLTLLNLVNLKKSFKLLNILKSPIQFKVGRNQFALFKYRIILYYNLSLTTKINLKLCKQFLRYFYYKNIKNMLSSNFYIKSKTVFK